jgi:transposase
VERVEAEAILDGDRESAISLLMRIGELIDANRRLEARVAELEQRLGRTSRNSSLPPSSDPPSVVKRPGKRSGRGRGGQPGHPGASRMQVPPERVDVVVEHWPSRCGGCDRDFDPGDRVEAGAPRRHQVAELPELAVTVTEHRLHAVGCSCGKTTRASLPAGVAESAFGPRLQAAVATLATRQRLSRRQISEMLDELHGCPVSVGAVDAIIGRVGEALFDPYSELRQVLPTMPVVHADETGWALAGERRWLWGGFTRTIAVFAFHQSRSQKACRELLGETPAGIVVSDRFGGYNHLPPGRRQVCWAHLARDFQAVSDRQLPADRRLGRQLLKISHAVFAAYDDYRAHRDPARLAREIEPTQQKLRALLGPASRGRREKTAGLARDLLKRWESLWLFVEHPDQVGPTNNHAERGLRPAVIKRKLSFGSSSERGLRATERLLTADGSCRLQHRSLFHYLTETLAAVTAGQPTPTLIPA